MPHPLRTQESLGVERLLEGDAALPPLQKEFTPHWMPFTPMSLLRRTLMSTRKYCETNDRLRSLKAAWEKIDNWLPKSPQARGIMLICSVFGLIASLMLISKLLNHVNHTKVHFDKTRNYTLVPFDELDAMRACQKETTYRYGNTLLRSHIDSHSSRMDKVQGLYKIFMFADIGTKKHFNEVTVHCFVDPKAFMIDHYRAIVKKQDTLLDKALGLLKF